VRRGSAKGALIGGAIGAALAIWATRYTCDSADCTSQYLGSMAVLGMLGAGIGAFVARPGYSGPAFPLTDAISVSPVLFTRTYGGRLTVGFDRRARHSWK
jgi:hypothetical protein